MKIDTDDVLVSKRLRVEGGFDQQSASSFGGPVVFSNTISVLGEGGIQADNLNLSGNLDQPRKIAMSETKPSIDGKVGDFVFNAIPISGQFAGWTYTTSGSWNRFGLISTSGDSNTINIDDATIGNLTVTGTIIGTGNITGDGSGLANLDADNITSGTIDADRVPILNQNTTGNAASADTVDVGGTNANATFYPIFTDNNGSAKSLNLDGNLYYNPSSNTLTAGTFSGSLNASNLSSGTVPVSRMNGTYAMNITGTATQADNINIDESNSNSNYQVTFSALNNGGYNRQYIDSDDSHLLYNPATATLSGLNISASNISGNGSQLEQLNATNLSSGTVADARIPSLDASKITAGTFADARIPSLDASKITAGTFADARIPSLNASKITAGTISVDRLPAETPNFFTNTIKITSTTLASDNKVYVSQGMVWFYETPEAGNTVAPSIQYASGVGMNSYMSQGDVIHIKLIKTVTAANQHLFDVAGKDLKVNNVFVPTYFENGRPSSSGTSGVDVYDITLYRVNTTGSAASDYKAIVSHLKCPDPA